MNDISAIIVVKNNPPYLSQTLLSIRNLVKEIIIADIGIDPSLLLKLKKNKLIKIIAVKKAVPYVELIREELKQYASCDYILLLDPDEVVPFLLMPLLECVYHKFDFCKIPRKNIIFGKWMRHSRWWPDYQIRLFKKKAVIWPKKIHHQPATSGNGYTVEPKENFALIHYNYENVDEFMQKAVRYAKSEAKELIDRNQPFPLNVALHKALSEFISRYFADKGYIDGTHGLVLSLLQMFYYILVYIYYWEDGGYNDEDEKTTQTSIFAFFKNGLYSINHWQSKTNISTYGEKIKRKILNKLLQ